MGTQKKSDKNRVDSTKASPLQPATTIASTKTNNHRKPVTDVPHTDISVLMNQGSERRQSMAGFDEDYVDIVDYIVRCTHKIWEERGIGLIYSHYAHNVVIHTTDGMTYGRDKVIADSLKTLSAFGDIRLFADDVIWSGNDKDGFHSSHRIGWTGHNTGYSIYGPPTGRKVTRFGIAHCFVKENRVVEEWISRDELALVRQLGFDEVELAKKMAAQDAARGVKSPKPLNQGEVERLRGQVQPASYPPPADEFDPEDFVRRSIHEIWNWRLLNKVKDYYVPNYFAHTSTNRQLYGLGDFKAYILARLAAFPDLVVLVDHICWLSNGPDGYRVATRWTLQGTHDGPGVYGEPTGKRIRLMGITHHEIQNGQFIREWSLFDEFALLKQLYAPEDSY
ncbi:MAG: ester cyclase [Anaerolineae bacterium]|nr:ester cyclase [Anaerolineae bacterium]